MRIPPSPPFSKGGTSPVPAQAELDFTTTPPFEKGGPGGIPAHQGARMTAAWMENLELLAEAPGGVERLRAMFTKMAILGAFTSCAAPDFETVQLGSVVNFKNGYAFKSEWFSKSGVRLARNANVGHGTLDWRECAYLREDLAGEYSAFGLSSGDILLSLDRPIISTGLKVAVVTDRDLPCLLLQRVAKLTPLAGRLAPDFLLHWLRSPLFVNVIDPGRSNGVPHISTKQVAALPIQLPPLAEQHRIVAKVDELMALCDRLEARQADAQHAHARLVQALLDSLTQARDAEEFQAAWERVAGEFPKIFSTPSSINGLQAAFLCMAAEGKLVPEGEGAQYLPISDLLLGDTLNGCSRKPSETPVGLQILRISAGTGSDDFYVDEADHKWVEVTAAEREKFRLVPNDLLACRFNGNLHYVGSFALYRGTSGVEQVFPDKLIRFRVDVGRALPDYLRFVMNALPARRQIEAFCATTVGNIGISATNLKTVKLRVPSMEEQHRIVAKVTELLALCDQLKAGIVAARAKQAQLAEALVKQAVATAAG